MVSQAMMLCTTTLCGPGSGPILADALRSVVEWADACIIIDTSDDPTVFDVAREVVGDKVVTRSWPWRADFAAARNAALDFASEIGAAFVLTLDADERIEPRGEDIRATLATSSSPAVGMMASDETYTKPRAVRLPSSARWVGRTHEALPANGSLFARARFAELEKTPEQMRIKFARDASILREETARDPSDGRWWYYLGASLHGLDDNTGAIEAWRRCAKISAWPEEAAWSCYRAASLLCDAGRYNECIDACSAGLARHAGIAELCWLAGVASYRAGRYEQAIHWARLAEVHGEHGDRRALNARIGFRDAHALGPGPADVLRHALAVTDRR